MLAAISVEGRVAGAELRRLVVDGELDERHQVRPVFAPFAGEGAQDGDDTFDALAGCVVVVRRAELLLPKISDAPGTSCRLDQKALMKRVSRSETSTLGRPASRNTEDTKMRAAVSAVAVFVQVSGHWQARPVSKLTRMMCTCTKSWPDPAARLRELDEVEAQMHRHGHCQ